MVTLGRFLGAVALSLGLSVILSCSPSPGPSEASTDDGSSTRETAASTESITREPEPARDEQSEPQLPKPEIEDGELYASNEKPPIESMGAFLDQYSDEELAQVTELTLSFNKITQVDNVARLRNLEHLNVIGNQVSTLDGAEVPSTLVSLSVSGNGIDSLFDIPAIENLQWLRAERNHITSTEGLDRFPKLKSLGLAYNPIEDFSGLLELTGMEYIAFSYNREVVGDEILDIVEQIRANNPDAEIYW